MKLGTVAMTEDEKKEILDSHFGKFGLDQRRLPYGLSDVPLSFVRTNLTISELQPFEETLTDAIQIAGAYGIPSVLVPRKRPGNIQQSGNSGKGCIYIYHHTDGQEILQATNCISWT